ncbi:MAG TPA: GNAT family N-acetyltransferase [Terriglobia bacterium]|nr:GNAT family N-acetyltransferase [Terriglobia bacterium]
MTVVIRRPNIYEHDSVRALVQNVVDEIYGGQWAAPPLPIDEESWGLAWIAVTDGKIIGVALTGEQWISDLRVLRQHRGHGVGQKLLEQVETEIANRGRRTFRLRVVKSNTNAVNFYLEHGWRVEREFPRERLPVTMLEMVKIQ